MSHNSEKDLLLTCPSCGTGNIIHLLNATDIAGETVLHCSKCKSAIGRWGDAQSARATKGENQRASGETKAEGPGSDAGNASAD